MKVEAIDDAHAIATSGPLVVCIWRTVTTLEAIMELKTIASRMVTLQKKGFAFFTVVETTADMPNAQVREELALLFRSVATSVFASALVSEGTGFRAAGIRGITTGINLIARQPFPHRVFANVDEGAGWVAKLSGDRLNLGGIVSTVQGVRAALDAAAATSRNR